MKAFKICMVALFTLCCPPCVYAQEWQHRVDSLVESIKTNPQEGRGLFYQYLDLINHTYMRDFNQYMEYARQGAQAAQEQDDIYWVAEFNLLIGHAFFHQGQLDSAQSYYDQTEQLRLQSVRQGKEDKNENDYLIIQTLYSKGSIDVIRGNFSLALNNYLSALAVAERVNDIYEISNIYYHLGSVYYKMSNYRQAENYYIKFEQLSRERGDSINVALAYVALSPIHTAKGDNESALRYAELGYQMMISEPNPNPDIMYATATRMAELLMEKKDNNGAMIYANESLNYAKQVGNPSHISAALYTLSTIYLRQGKNRLSEKTAFEALATDSTDIYVKSVIYGNIAQANIRMGNSEKAIEYFSKTMDANRAYSNQNFQASLSEMEVKYETEKKETQIAALEAERRLMIWLGIAAGVILLLTLTAFFYLWRSTLQKKRIVATKALLDGELAERTRLAKDLHDGLGGMLTGIKLSLENMRNDNDSNFTICFNLLNDSMKEMRRISHHLMPDALQNEGLKSALISFCKSFPNVQFGYFGSDERVEPQMEIAIYRIIYELVNNALKHSGASEILVQVMREADYIALTVRDNGQGFDTSAISEGVGLRNIRDRVTSSGGRILIDSRIGEGTEININFMIKQR